MINAQMKDYTYSVYDETEEVFDTVGEPYNIVDEYGQETLNPIIGGTIKMAINILTEGTENSVLYTGANYIGLTFDNVTDRFVIDYGNEKLKVLYVNNMGRFKQAYLQRM